MPRFATSFILSVVSASPLLARSPQFVTFPTDRLPDGLGGQDGGGPPEFYGGTALGDFDGDRITDGFVLRGTTLLYVNDFMIDGLVTVVATGITDVRTLRGAFTNQDGCATAGPDGLRVWRYDEVAALTTADNATCITSVHPTSSAWVNAAALACGDINGDGLDDVVGLDEDREHLLTMLATTTPGTFVDGPTTTLSETATAIELVDLACVGTKQLAVATASGVRIHLPMSPSAEPIDSNLGVYDYIRLACYRGPDDKDRLVAMSRVYPGVGQGIFVERPGTSTTVLETEAIVVPEFDLVSIAPFDADLDGDMDLGVNSRSVRDVGILLQDPSLAPPFSAGNLARWWIVAPGDTLSGADPGRNARLAAADLDGDLDFDMVHGDDPTASVTVLRNTIVNHEPKQPHMVLRFDWINPTGLRLYGEFQPQAGYDSTTTHVEVIVYRRPIPTQPATPDAVAHVLMVIPQVSSPPTMMVPFTLPETAVPFGSHYWLVCRYVRISSGAIKWGGPPRVYELQISDDIEDALKEDAGLPILSNGVIPQPSGAKGVFAKPTAKPKTQ